MGIVSVCPAPRPRTQAVRKERATYNYVYDNHDGWSGQKGDKVL